MYVDFDIAIPKRKAEQLEVFNLRNKTCQKETDENTKLLECFENELPLEVQSRNWLKVFNSILYKCFKKV
jgi:hypothetical protein